MFFPTQSQHSPILLKFTTRHQGQENEAFDAGEREIVVSSPEDVNSKPQSLRIRHQNLGQESSCGSKEEEAIKTLEETIMGAAVSSSSKVSPSAPDEKTVLKTFATTLMYNAPKEEFPDKQAFGKDDGNEDENDEEDENGEKRQQWTNPVEFLLSCIAMSVGLGNLN